ncbi:PEPxxWA-CTERM sorting domain-containing protein, partial [Phenylobacterium sp.]|uniref:PEPxxWA-CTERM sorting domain-containing protein n=1 Tax=Phenylobacterium sp. TaxID=1871053 RepID=UPI002F4080EA
GICLVLGEDHMRKVLLGLAASSAILVAGAANAAVTVQYWVNQTAVAQNATIANVTGLGTPSGTGSVSTFNFSTSNSPGTSIDTWLGISTGINGSHALDNTVFLFTGSTFLHAGVNNYTIEHDDGVQLSVGGISGFPLNAPGPTPPESTAFSITAPSAGNYSFTLSYGECCEGPAVLQILPGAGATPFGSPTPEPATWGLMLAGFGAMGAALRSRRRLQTA